MPAVQLGFTFATAAPPLEAEDRSTTARSEALATSDRDRARARADDEHAPAPAPLGASNADALECAAHTQPEAAPDAAPPDTEGGATPARCENDGIDRSTDADVDTPQHTLAGSARTDALARCENDGIDRSTDADVDTPQHTLAGSARTDALARVLQSGCPLPVVLTITDNRRTMLSVRRGPQRVEVRLHHMFVQGNATLWSALADYLFDRDRAAAQHIASYVAQHRAQIRRPPAPARARAGRATTGTHHDLDEIFHSVNTRYFDGSVDAQIAWARAASPASSHHASTVRRSIKLGSYNSRTRMIRVHPALDAAFVPRFFVEYIVYHEMLHQVVPPEMQDGRREMHSARFKAREREFQAYRAALDWERDNLARVLRNRGRRQARSDRSML